MRRAVEKTLSLEETLANKVAVFADKNLSGKGSN